MLTSTIPMQEGTREVVLPAYCSILRMPCWRVQRGRCRATGGRVGGGSGAGRWVALWRQLLDRLNVVAEAERRGLRPIGPGGYTGGECHRALVKPCSPAGTSCPTGRCWPGTVLPPLWSWSCPTPLPCPGHGKVPGPRSSQAPLSREAPTRSESHSSRVDGTELVSTTADSQSIRDAPRPIA